MTYTLDTNALTAILTRRGDAAQTFREKLAAGHDVTLNAISYFEFKRGLILPRFSRTLAEFQAFVAGNDLLPLNEASLDQAVMVYQNLRAAGRLLEDADILVAGIALAHDAVLVTRNLKHFRRIEGLRLESWEA